MVVPQHHRGLHTDNVSDGEYDWSIYITIIQLSEQRIRRARVIVAAVEELRETDMGSSAYSFSTAKGLLLADKLIFASSWLKRAKAACLL